MFNYLIIITLLVFFHPTIFASEMKPNVVIIVADDLGFADVSFKGSPIDTPSLDRLAKEGIVFNRFYTSPICSPTRAALMTGRDPIRLGVAYSVVLPWDSGGVHSTEHFMPESFQAAGYQTAMMGKWHLGHSQQSLHPNNRGFEHFYGHLHTSVGFYPPFASVGGKDFQRNGISISEKGYETYLLADETVSFIKERDPSRPFFLYIPFLAPHEPLAAPKELIDKYNNLPDKRLPARSPSDKYSAAAKAAGIKSRVPLYAAVVDAMDQAIGKILDALDEEGLTDDTIVMFFSDNGASRIFSRGGGNNYPLRGGKAEVYEGGIRVISMLRWPQQIEPEQTFKPLMTVMDLFPTLASATGVNPLNQYPFDGIDMWPSLKRKESVERNGYVMFGSEIPRYGSFNFTAFDESWKLVQWVEQGLTEINIRNELFNIANDPSEKVDLASLYPQRVAEMSEAIKSWRSLHPINGVRARISSPPGWHAPLDWAEYPIPTEKLQVKPATAVTPNEQTLYRLDYAHGERGRLVYNCEPVSFKEGICKVPKLNKTIQSESSK